MHEVDNGNERPLVSAVFRAKAARGLAAPERSLTDGSRGQPVAALCMTLRRVEVCLRLDAITAQRVAELSRAYRRLRYRIVPTLLAISIASAIFALYSTKQLESAGHHAGILILVSYTILIVTVLATSLILLGIGIPLKRKVAETPQYPSFSLDGNITVARLDPEAARRWAAVNGGAIRIIDPIIPA